MVPVLVMLCVALALAVVLLTVKIVRMRRTARTICEEFAEKLRTDTNTLVSVPSRDRAMLRLAEQINVELRRLRRQRRCYVQGDIELKNAVTNISHDLRTPLTAICGYLDLLEKEQMSEAAARYVGVIRNRTDILKQLTEELFRYSVITSPECEEPAVDVSLNAVLEESLAGFYAAMQAAGIAPQIRMPEEKVVRRLNRAALSRVFSNLLGNAVKYSDGDLEVELTADGTVTFSNAASGLDEVQVGRLFDRFYTVEAARHSTGLGLAIARTLVERMNGRISASYRNGRLCIRLELPGGR